MDATERSSSTVICSSHNDNKETMRSSSAAASNDGQQPSGSQHQDSNNTSNKAMTRTQPQETKQRASRISFRSNSKSSARSINNIAPSASYCCRPSSSSAAPPPSYSLRGINRAVWMGRAIFLTFLCTVAAVMGYLSFFLLTDTETSLAETVFASIADRALHSAVTITKRKRLGGVSLATVASFAAPNADEWPFVTIKGFSDIASKMIDTSSADDSGFVPFVQPEDLQAFEEFAFNYYETKRSPPFPNGTAVSSFGKLVWEPDMTGQCNTPDRKCPVPPDGSVPYDSPNDMIAPILHHSLGAHPILMVNTRYEAGRGTLIDNMVACAQERSSREASSSSLEDHVCDGLADIFFVPNGHFGQPLQGPLSVIMHPIFPANDNTKLTGFIGSSIVWQDVLENGFNSQVNGIDCVLESNTQQRYTYSVSGGVPSFRGQGDLHDPTYDKYRVSVSLTGEGLFSETSVSLTLTLYPTKAFFETYSTSNPQVACAGAVLIIIATSLCFVLYDFAVQQAFRTKQEQLRAKRAFMRYISHEVRTPLNSVCTGLTLLRGEMETALGFLHGESEDKPDHRKLVVEMEEDQDKNAAVMASDDDPFNTTSPTLEDVGTEKVVNWLQLTTDIQSSALSSVDVLSDLLQYDKIENGQLKLELTMIPIWTLINRTVHEFDLPARTKSLNMAIRFSPEVDPECVEPSIAEHMLIGDQVRIVQCIRNLTSNAVKFSRPGGDLTVSAWLRKSRPNGLKSTSEEEEKEIKLHGGEIVVCQPGGYLELVVSDTGAGLSPDQLAQLFTAGLQFNATENQNGGGSGLGLCIAKGIVEQHGGTLEAASLGLGMGATFTMILPLNNVREMGTCSSSNHSETAPVEPHSPFPTRPVEQFLPLRLLVVDDAALNRRLLVRLLENHGHSCDQACNGQEAVDTVKKAMEESNPYHSILMDYEMDVKDGPTATTEIRDLGCDCFIVGITGNLLEEDVRYFQLCGAQEVLPKPFQMSELEMLWTEYGVVGTTPTD